MTRRARLSLVALATAVALPLLAAAPVLHARAAPPAAQPRATVQVTIQNFAFSPQTITIAPGTTVVWTQKDSAPHTVTSDDNAFVGSANLSAGQSFSYTFTKPGTYHYHCAVHPYMKATVIVTGAGASGGVGTTGMGMAAMGPMSKASLTAWTGWYDKHKVLFLSTDTSSKDEAMRDHINYASSLAKSLAHTKEIYLIMNGKYAGRGPVFGSEPGEDDYTPLWQEVQVTWKNSAQAVALGSDDQINGLARQGKLTLTMTGTVLNCPIIKVLGGS